MTREWIGAVIGVLCCFFIHAEPTKVVVITGASRGVGFATAEHLSANGLIVYGIVRNDPPKTEKNIHFLKADLLDADSIQNAIQIVLSKEGRIDVLINNAGYALIGPVEALTQHEIHDQMEVNFFAPIRCIQEVLPAMRSQKSGRIINISSINAFGTPPFGSMYAASKSALETLSESLCVEVRPYGIFVSIVEPGLIQTHFSLPMGTKEMVGNPYQAIIDGIKTDVARRMDNPALLSPSQSPQEIGEFLLSVIQDPEPKLRCQTSENAKQIVSKKLIDITGEMYLKEMKQFYGSKNKE